MSQLLIKQKVFALSDTYNVYDESGNPKYFIKNEFFKLAHKLHVYDREGGVELGMIQQKLFHLLMEFEIFINGYSWGIIKQQLSFLKPKYSIEYKNWRLEGDIFHWNYSVYEGDRLVVTINRKLFQWGDTYVLNVANPEDELPALMVVITMDLAREAAENAAANSH